jgi:hypothetical protein
MTDRYRNSMTEADLQEALAHLMQLFGFFVVHWRPGRHKSGGWSVPVTYNGKGWPDLVGFHPSTGTIIAIECKSTTGRVTSEQTGWLQTMAACGVHTVVARPSNYHDIAETIQTFATGGPEQLTFEHGPP